MLLKSFKKNGITLVIIYNKYNHYQKGINKILLFKHNIL